MASNKDYFNAQQEAIREKAMCADGTTEEPIVPENTYSMAADILKTLAVCGAVMVIGMGAFWAINSITKK